MKDFYDKKHTMTFYVNDEGHGDLYFSAWGGPRFSNEDMKRNALACLNLQETELESMRHVGQWREKIMQRMRELNCYEPYYLKQGVTFFQSMQPLTLSLAAQGQAQEHTVQFVQESNVVIAANSTSQLPILKECVDVLKEPLYHRNFSQSLNNTLLLLVQQGFSTTVSLLESLLDLGFKPENIILMTKPHTTSTANQARLQAITQTHGMSYIDTSDEFRRGETYQRAKQLGIERLIHKAHERIKSSSNIQNILLHDEGGTVYQSDSFQRQWLNEWKPRHLLLSNSEHTTSGVNARRANPHLNLPCVLMASSWLKKNIEAYFIAEKSFWVVKQDIDARLCALQQGQKLVLAVVGCGNIGAQLVRHLVEHYANKPVQILISDTQMHNKHEAARRLAARFHMLLNDQEGQAYLSFETMVSMADLVFGCTGQDIARGYARPNLQTEREVVLYSLSSGEREYASLLHDIPALELLEPETVVRDNGLVLRVMNGGRPIIFKPELADAIHPQKIQLIRALTLCTLMQQLEYFSLQAHLRSAPIHAMIALNAALQDYLWQRFVLFQRILPDRRSDRESLRLPLDILNQVVNLELVMRESEGGCVLSMSHASPHALNRIDRFDENHDLHLVIREPRQFSLVFVKHGTVLEDLAMLERYARDGFKLQHYVHAHPVEKISMLMKLSQKLNHSQSSFRPETMACPADEQRSYLQSKGYMGTG